MEQRTRTRFGVCKECGETFTAGKAGAIASRCPECRTKRPSCRGCGGVIPLVLRGGPRGGWIASGYYCSESCRPRCSIDGCDRPTRKRGWCGRHYALWHDHGSAEIEPKFRRSSNRPFPAPKQPLYRWATKSFCLVCGLSGESEAWKHSSRKFCSPNCAQLWRKHKGKVPDSINCATCGVIVSLSTPRNGKRRRSDTAFCDAHARHGRIWITARELAASSGEWCRLCGFVVDMTVRHPDSMSPTVDHIVPRALGGSDEPENLQLAHKGCNSSKRHSYIG